MNDYNFLEDDLEQASLEWLEEIGYEVHNGSELASDGVNSDRENFSEVVLKNRLKFALQPGFPERLTMKKLKITIKH